jgi:CRISPR-associated endonuclease/helicase Cas3
VFSRVAHLVSQQEQTMGSMETTYWAHSQNLVGHRHKLSEHLLSVANLAHEAASRWPWAEEARLAGLLHDLGKYGDLFQARLRGEESGLDHWSAGAMVACTDHRALAAALAIEGHHVGLCSASALKDRMRHVLAGRSPFGAALRMSGVDLADLTARARADGSVTATPEQTAVPLIAGAWQHAIARMLDVRLLFSCLVDADFLDTEAHFAGNQQGKQRRPPGPQLEPDRALEQLDAYMANSVRGKRPASVEVTQARAGLWEAVGSAAEAPMGLFTLTAPTGSGKTLAMLRFALAHAKRYQLRRIILAVPYLSIIEQTANIYRAVFRDQPLHYVLEHHSLAGGGAERSQTDAEGRAHEDAERQRQLLSENWDAPIVITTNVQLLESLFSNRPSACRKLHNLRDAVILFDEAQSLPQHLAVPTLAALSHLCVSSHSSVVFATATQPAFDALHEAVGKHAAAGWRPVECVPNHAEMFNLLKRVDVTWPHPNETLEWPALAARLREESPQSLCIVNLKRHALALLETLAGEEGLLYLSTNLCAEHRRTVLDEVRARLNADLPCRLVSTQCVEAGVDLDFPRVYRAMAPLEAIAQAAGRCNREGRLNEAGALGRVEVFEPAMDASARRFMFPTFAYFQAAQVTMNLLRASDGHLDINDPALYRSYYRRLYNLSDPAQQKPELNNAITAIDFPEIARQYRLIEQDAIQVVVPWSQRMDLYEQLRREASHGIDKKWLVRAQTLAVSIYRPSPNDPAWGSLVAARFRNSRHTDRTRDDWFVLEDPNRDDPKRRLYDDVLGLRLPTSPQVMIA